MNVRHPMQPIVNIDGDTRFKANEIVKRLLTLSPYSFDELEYLHFSDEDREQFAQLLGMSVTDYVELPFVSERSNHEAQLAEDELNPSNPYAWELSWVDETNACCACDSASCGEIVVHNKACWFCFGTGQNSRIEFVNGKLDVVGLPCAACKGSRHGPITSQSTR